ncbi:hypothetical protein D4L80_14980 [Shigella sonnei]|nr:hypothetical protein [Shigella sonnei]
MFTGLITRFKKRLQQKRLQALRESLRQEFHKNIHNPYVRTFSGLRLLTLPINVDTEPYHPSLRGNLELRIANLNILYQRLAFYINEYQRTINGTSIEWLSLPESLSKQKDSSENRWLDTYFGTSNPAVAYYKLTQLLELIEPYEDIFLKPRTDEDRALVNHCAHLFREMEVLIEHYLLNRPV